MTGYELKAARLASAWTENKAGEKLGVTQAYLSMVERGARVVSTELAARAVAVLNVPATALPLGSYRRRRRSGHFFQRALGALGYPGFEYMRGQPKLNPAALLIEALDTDDLDSRVTEGLPWIPVAYPKMDWRWLTLNAKVLDRQNRLAFVVALAEQIAAKKGDSVSEKVFLGVVGTAERSRLAAEDTLCRESMTKTERNWLRTHRSPTAKHWNLLTDLCVERWIMPFVKRPHEPWDAFLKDLDAAVKQNVRLDCIGGFVVTQFYGGGDRTARWHSLQEARYLH
jgi:transcriptional regulator with XRE-family HTH domain